MPRREALGRIAGALAAAAVPHPPVAAEEGSNPIRLENAKPGTRDWILTRPRIDPASKFRCPWIEGYASAPSIRAGERTSFHVSTNPPSPFTLELFRLGWKPLEGLLRATHRARRWRASPGTCSRPGIRSPAASSTRTGTTTRGNSTGA